MSGSWQTESGDLSFRWSEAGRRVEFLPAWMLDISSVQCESLQPFPDFASHSPFGGAYWFQPFVDDRDSESRPL